MCTVNHRVAAINILSKILSRDPRSQTGGQSIKLAFAVTESGTGAAAGDYFTAFEFGSALNDRFGWQIEYRPKGDGWYDLDGIDLLMVMIDEYDLHAIRNPTPHLVKIAWARNWFERWCENSSISAYDLVFASSKLAARFMSQRAHRLVNVLRIATNSVRFAIGSRCDSPSWDVVFTGSHWHSERDIVDALVQLPAALRIAVYGKNWEQVSEMTRYHKGFVPYGELPAVYAQSSIVIDDANHVTKEWGAANSRVFDALAAGCLVITNSATVSYEVFGGLLPVYTEPAHLAELVRLYLEDEPARLELQSKLRQIVLKRNQYKHRAFELGFWLDSFRKR